MFKKIHTTAVQIHARASIYRQQQFSSEKTWKIKKLNVPERANDNYFQIESIMQNLAFRKWVKTKMMHCWNELNFKSTQFLYIKNIEIVIKTVNN